MCCLLSAVSARDDFLLGEYAMSADGEHVAFVKQRNPMPYAYLYAADPYRHQKLFFMRNCGEKLDNLRHVVGGSWNAQVGCSKTGRLMLAGSKIFDIRKDRCLKFLYDCSKVSFCPINEGAFVDVGSFFIQVCDLETGARDILSPPEGVFRESVEFSEDGSSIIALGSDAEGCKMSLYDLRSKKATSYPISGCHSKGRLCGTMLYCNAARGQVGQYDLRGATSGPVNTFPGAAKFKFRCLSRDGRYLVMFNTRRLTDCLYQEGSQVVYNTASGAIVKQFGQERSYRRVDATQFNEDGSLLSILVRPDYKNFDVIKDEVR